MFTSSRRLALGLAILALASPVLGAEPSTAPTPVFQKMKLFVQSKA
jgi:hypothetical protein